jgi:hypothetical protein
LGDELGEGGSGVLVDEAKLGSSIGPRSSIIGGDKPSGSGTDSDLDLASDPPILSGSDVNLIAGDGDDSDVKIVTGKPISLESDSDELLLSSGRDVLAEIDSGELMLSDDMPAITHDSAVLDLAIEPNAGSTGPITDKELKEVAEQNPDLMAGKKSIASDSGLAFDDDDEDSGDDLIGAESNDDMLGEDLDLQSFGNKAGEVSLDSGKGSGMSSLEMLDDLDLGPGSGGGSGLASRSSRGLDVLSELDLLSADAGGSGLITGDSGNVLGSGGVGSSGVGSGKGSGKGSGSKGSGLDFDDALADDDDLVIADDEDDLVLGGGASDISVSGDSGINLMSPSDSGLSLESEPLDLAGSSISALDLGSEFGSGSGLEVEAGYQVRRKAVVDRRSIFKPTRISVFLHRESAGTWTTVRRSSRSKIARLLRMPMHSGSLSSETRCPLKRDLATMWLKPNRWPKKRAKKVLAAPLQRRPPHVVEPWSRFTKCHSRFTRYPSWC